MSRPEEKAMAMLNKWTEMKKSHDKKQNSSNPNSGNDGSDRTGRRPYLSSLCASKYDAEFWRKQLLNEISSSISKIQNTSLPESTIRDINDTINKLLREKYHWNKRIRELGGTDYIKLEKSNMEISTQQGEGSLSLTGSSGYQYFGAAKELPGVKELFAKNASKVMKREYGDLRKLVDVEYYGFRDEEDGILVQAEAEEEAKLVKEINVKRLKLAGDDSKFEYSLTSDSKEEGSTEWGSIISTSGDILAGKPIDVIPSQELIKKELFELKKRELLDNLGV